MSFARMVCLALVCLALGVSGEAPESPWPVLTPKAFPAKQTFNQEHAIAQLALTLEEEVLVEMLPFKAPFKMDKKQMAVVIRLLKKLVKPILKSERLRTMVAIIDGYIQDLAEEENKKYYADIADIAQNVRREVKRVYNSEEVQGRTFETMTNIYRESVLNNYIVQPFTNWIISPITSRISLAAERISEMLPTNTWIVDTEYYNPFSTWGETFDYYVDRISNWSARSRSALEATARLIEEQEGRACDDCGNSAAWGGSDSDSTSTDVQ